MVRRGFRLRVGAVFCAAVFLLVACSDSGDDKAPQVVATAASSSAMAPAVLPVYPPAPTTGPLVSADFTFVKGCSHPCTAPVRVGPGNSYPAMVTSWPCEYYVDQGRGFCIDEAKAKSGFRDQVRAVCRAVGNSDLHDGNLSDDRANPTRDWIRVVIPPEIAQLITHPALPTLAADGTYQGYIFGGWLRRSSDPRGYPQLDASLADCKVG